MRSVLTFNIVKIIVRAHKWRNTNINGQPINKRPVLFLKYSIAVAISVAGAYFLGNGIDQDFVGYSIAAYSVFVGLFLNVVLNMHDKYMDRLPKETGTHDNKIIITQLTNFTDQFISLTVYAILIAFVCILLLSLTLLSDSLTVNLEDIQLIPSLDHFDTDSFWMALKYLGVLGYRIVVFYLSLDFMRISLFAISSMYEKMLSTFPTQ